MYTHTSFVRAQAVKSPANTHIIIFKLYSLCLLSNKKKQDVSLYFVMLSSKRIYVALGTLCHTNTAWKRRGSCKIYYK